MSEFLVRVFIQARMGSKRFPGKVLAPFRGEALLRQVIRRVEAAVNPSVVNVLTSYLKEDFPIYTCCRAWGVSVVMGSLDNVYLRFLQAVREYPCDYFLRICADSPLVNPEVIKQVIRVGIESGGEADVVTTVFPSRTFPAGSNVEMVKTSAFLAVDPVCLTQEEREHPTKYFYNHFHNYHIIQMKNPGGDESGLSVVVDTIEDLRRLELLFSVDQKKIEEDIEEERFG